MQFSSNRFLGMKHRPPQKQGTRSLACHCNNDDSGLWGYAPKSNRGLCDRLDPDSRKRAVRRCLADEELERIIFIIRKFNTDFKQGARPAF